MESLRYSRQMIMPQIGSTGQEALQSSKVLIVGAGGIGSTVALYLAASGVPTDVLDFDRVEVSNLHRCV
jgi:adenylyltransferase/sulfurtransferase